MPHHCCRCAALTPSSSGVLCRSVVWYATHALFTKDAINVINTCPGLDEVTRGRDCVDRVHVCLTGVRCCAGCCDEHHRTR